MFTSWLEKRISDHKVENHVWSWVGLLCLSRRHWSFSGKYIIYFHIFFFFFKWTIRNRGRTEGIVKKGIKGMNLYGEKHLYQEEKNLSFGKSANWKKHFAALPGSSTSIEYLLCGLWVYFFLEKEISSSKNLKIKTEIYIFFHPNIILREEIGWKEKWGEKNLDQG